MMTIGDAKGLKPLAKGGWTSVDILDREGNIVASGWAECSLKDNYNKKIGREIAAGRALKEFWGARSSIYKK